MDYFGKLQGKALCFQEGLVEEIGACMQARRAFRDSLAAFAAEVSNNIEVTSDAFGGLVAAIFKDAIVGDRLIALTVSGEETSVGAKVLLPKIAELQEAMWEKFLLHSKSSVLDKFTKFLHTLFMQSTVIKVATLVNTMGSGHTPKQHVQHIASLDGDMQAFALLVAKLAHLFPADATGMRTISLQKDKILRLDLVVHTPSLRQLGRPLNDHRWHLQHV